MRRFKALLLCITLIIGYVGMGVCENALSNKKPEGSISQAIEVTGTTAPSATKVPKPTDEPMLLLNNYEANSIFEQEPSAFNLNLDLYKDIEIPEVEIAEINDKEDPVKVVKRTPAQENNHTTNVEEVKKTAYSSNRVLELGDDYELKTRIGIDVSSWNEKIDWKQVADSGVEFVMIRIGYRGSVYGKIVLDHYFYDNIEGALANGLDVGIYFYSQAINEEEAIQEAAWICDIIKNYNVTYPVAFDMEEVEINRIANVSFEQLNKNAVAFLNYVAAKGYTPCMYGCKSYLEYVWDMKLYKNCYVWVAHVGVTETTYKGHYDMWQYSWTGKIPGILENVDMNIEYKVVPKNQPTEAPPEQVDRPDEPTLSDKPSLNAPAKEESDKKPEKNDVIKPSAKPETDKPGKTDASEPNKEAGGEEHKATPTTTPEAVISDTPEAKDENKTEISEEITHTEEVNEADISDEAAKEEPTQAPIEETITEPEYELNATDDLVITADYVIKSYGDYQGALELAEVPAGTVVNRIGTYENGYSLIELNGARVYVLTSCLMPYSEEACEPEDELEEHEDIFAMVS